MGAFPFPENAVSISWLPGRPMSGAFTSFRSYAASRAAKIAWRSFLSRSLPCWPTRVTTSSFSRFAMKSSLPLKGLGHSLSADTISPRALSLAGVISSEKEGEAIKRTARKIRLIKNSPQVKERPEKQRAQREADALVFADLEQ